MGHALKLSSCQVLDAITREDRLGIPRIKGCRKDSWGFQTLSHFDACSILPSISTSELCKVNCWATKRNESKSQEKLEYLQSRVHRVNQQARCLEKALILVLILPCRSPREKKVRTTRLEHQIWVQWLWSWDNQHYAQAVHGQSRWGSMGCTSLRYGSHQLRW